MIRTLTVVVYSSIAVLFVLPWLMLWSLLTQNQDLMYQSSMKAVRFILAFVGVRIRVEGLENIPPRVCIFAANHVSNIDPLVFVTVIPRRVSLLLKKELFRIPILSTGMKMAKFVSVDRAARKAAAESVKVAVQYLKEGLSFALYPEGTRSPDGRLRSFKKGTFVMALQAGVPIVPVSIAGAHRLMRKGHLSIYPGEVVVRFGLPVDVSKYSIQRRDELIAEVEALVAAGLPADQQPLREAKGSA